MSATILGTTKGIIGVTPTVTGMVIESVDVDYGGEDLEFPNQDGDITAFSQVSQKADFTIKGLFVAGTSYAGTINSTIALTLSAHLPAGNASGNSVIKNIKVGEQFKGWKSIEISGTYLPKLVIT